MSAAATGTDRDDPLLCEVFRSPRREGTYLYVSRAEGLARVPDSLLQQFGEPVRVMTLPLTPQRRLARVSAAAVLDAIDAQGFFLQLPPTAAHGAGDKSHVD